MMSRGLVSVLRLCWILSLILSFVHGQFLNNNDIIAKIEEMKAQGTPLDVDLDGSIADRLTDALNANNGEDNQRKESAKEAQPTQARSSLRAANPQIEAPQSSLRAAIPEDEAPQSSLRAAIPSPASSFVPPFSSLRAAVPSPMAPVSSLLTVSLPSRSITATVTVSKTVMVEATANPAPVETATPAATATPSGSVSADSEPLIAETSTPMSSMAKAGMGVGLTFGVLSVAGIAGLYLWRRHHNRRDNDDSDKSEQNNIFGKLLGFKRYRDNKEDPEWSIESAEKVAIVKNMRAQSVSTISRSDSTSSDGSRPGTGGGAAIVAVKKRKLSLPNTALGSHPITPDISSFPTPPSVPANLDSEKDAKSEKKNSWPLPD